MIRIFVSRVTKMLNTNRKVIVANILKIINQNNLLVIDIENILKIRR